MKYTTIAALLLTILAGALAGCGPKTSFERDLQIRDSIDGRAIGQAWIVRALFESTEKRVGMGNVVAKDWSAVVDIIPAGDQVEYQHPDNAPDFSTDAFSSEIRGSRYYEIFLLADGYAPMRINAKELNVGQFQMRRLETVPTGREIIRAADFVEQTVLPNTQPTTPGRAEVLRLLIAQLQSLQDRGMTNMGLAGRISSLQAALPPTLAE